MKALLKVLAIVCVLSFTATAALAVDGGDPKWGKRIYKKECKSCHSDGGEGGLLTPLSMTQSQWDDYFTHDKHRANPEVFQKLENRDGGRKRNVQGKDLLDAWQFLYDHAADSPQPQTCG